MAQQYIGVYATQEKGPSIGEFPRPTSARKRLWFVWELPESKYKVQALNAVFQPMSEPRVIPAREFAARFTHESEHLHVPEGYAHPTAQGLDAAGASLPDLFFGEDDSGCPTIPPTQRPEPPRKLMADDPNLLAAWAKADPSLKSKTADPVKMPFDRLVGEVAPDAAAEGEERPPSECSEPSVSAVMPEASEKTEQAGEEEAQQSRQMRSNFVQALLLLRRGARAQSLSLLEEMLSQPYEYFEGGAQLLSEFGLGLRRLGLIPLALAAHRRALEFAPNDERVLFNIARTYHDLGFLPEARDYLEKALAVAPDFVQARQFMMFLEVSGEPGNG